MLKALFVTLQLSVSSCAYLYATPLLAQVASDGTVNTQVNQNGNVAEITGGETRGSNLFHSFQDFSVPTGNEAFFNNANDISNIFGRVTGGNISNIDGAIRANSSASLFLINPAGIVFGENASLNLGGSFYGFTSSSIVFEDGEFSAVDNLEQPILTVNAPIGLSFRDNPGEIINRSLVEDNTGETIGLEVNQGNTLALIGGELNFEAGQTTAQGGNIYLGGLAEAGVVSFNQDGSLIFPQNLALADVTLTNAANVDVRGTGEGNITVDAQNLTLEAGEFGSSSIRSGIVSESTSPEAQAGNVTVNVAENIRLNNSGITNQVNLEGMGNSGNITINTGSLELINGGQVSANTLGQGNAGAVSVTATGDITADGEDSDSFSSGITSQVGFDAVGEAGGINISASNLNLSNGGRVDASTGGQGDAGAVSVTATGDITIDGENSDGFVSGITSGVDTNAEGSSGGIMVSTFNLNLSNGGRVDASTGGQGNAEAINVTATGDITVDGENSDGIQSRIASAVGSGAVGDAAGVTVSTSNLNLTNGGQVIADTFGRGNTGAINIIATGDITVGGVTSEGFQSGITSQVSPDAVGDAAGVTISTSDINLTNGGRVSGNTFGRGNAGAVSVIATGDITADGENSDGFPSSISSQVSTDAVGDAAGVTVSTSNFSLTNGGRVDASTGGQDNAGDINISTNNLNLFNGGIVDASTFGQGNASDINITATESISINGFAELSRSGISANAFNENGNGGNISINTGSLTIANGGTIEATNFVNFGNDNLPGTGRPGSIDIVADSIELDNSARIETATQFTDGVSGIINLQVAEDITLKNNSFISAQAFGNANGGNLTIDARYVIAFPSSGTGNDLIATAEGGSGGNIEFNVDQLFGFDQRNAVDQDNNFLLNDTNDLDVSGIVDGTLTINALDFNPLERLAELPSNPIDAHQTTQQACQANRETLAQNGFAILGKGGVPPEPGLTLNSSNIYVDSSNSAQATPSPIATAQGKVQPARGIKLTKSGEIILTAYQTNNAGERIPQGSRNCG